MIDSYEHADIKPDWVKNADAKPFSQAITQINEYFDGVLMDFNIPLEVEGTDFQKTVWDYLKTIPYGQTTSYGRIAAEIGQSSASRAVGLANGQNPIGIIIPCHRVIGANGKLTGYAGGLHRKQKLLNLEQQTIAKLGLAPQLTLL